MNDGGPAFPRASNPEAADFRQVGMSLRDYFAAVALQGMAAEMVKGGYPTDNFIEGFRERELIAETAYRLADAMLQERENGK